MSVRSLDAIFLVDCVAEYAKIQWSEPGWTALRR